MRKSINLVVGVFLFVLVFSFSVFRTEAATRQFSSSVNIQNVNSYFNYINLYANESYNPMPGINLPGIFDDTIPQAELYRVNLTSNALVNVSRSGLAMPNFTIFSIIDGTNYTFNNFRSGNSTSFSNSNTFDIFISRDVGIISPRFYGMFDSADNWFSTNISVNLSLTINSIEALSDSDIDQYEAGYNAGYSVGLEEGTNAGYSSGYSAGYSQGTNAGYNSGFQAGVNSVDTQSYYDSGYQAGQASGYSTGYEDGYDSGFQEAMSRIDSWGADTKDYPLLVKDIHLSDGYMSFSTVIDNYAYYQDTEDGGFYRYSYSGEYIGSNGFFDNPNFEINPNHVYAIELTDFYTSLNGSGVVYLNMGSSEFCFSERDEEFKANIKLFANGSELGNNISFKVNGVCQSNSLSKTQYIYFNNFRIYDYGPVGDTQNHIANQTDDLTNGYDSSSGESASNTFANDASSYEQAESNIFTSAKNDLNNFQFYDIGSNSSVLVGLSFVSSSMTAIFGAMGGMTGGAGIVLSVLFSVMLVSIVIGTYRYFVSSGKTGKSSSMKGGKG